MNKILVVFILILIFTVFISLPTLAQQGGIGQTTTGGTVSLENPLGNTPTPQVLIGRVINAILGIVGSLALAMFIYGGFMWMLSAGNNERVQKGKDILVWATIGLIVIFAAYGIVRQVFLLLK